MELVYLIGQDNNDTLDMLDVELDGKVISKPDPRKARLDVIEKAMKNRSKILIKRNLS